MNSYAIFSANGEYLKIESDSEKSVILTCALLGDDITFQPLDGPSSQRRVANHLIDTSKIILDALNVQSVIDTLRPVLGVPPSDFTLSGRCAGLVETLVHPTPSFRSRCYPS